MWQKNRANQRERGHPVEAEDLREIVREELENQSVTESPAREGGFWAVLRHPLLLTVVGFAMTTLLGTLITQSIAERSERRAEIAAAQEALADFTSQMHEVRLQQDYLLRTMIRGAGTEDIAEAKARYDAAYLGWITNRSRNHLKIRTFFGFTNSNFAEQIINRTIHQDFREMDDCLNDLYLNPLGDAGEITGRLNRCIESYAWQGVQTETGFVDAATRRNSKVFQCIRDISDTMMLYIARDLHCASSSWHANEDGKIATKAAYDGLWAKCGFGAKAEFNRHTSGFTQYCTVPTDENLLMWALR